MTYYLTFFGIEYVNDIIALSLKGVIKVLFFKYNLSMSRIRGQNLMEQATYKVKDRKSVV